MTTDKYCVPSFPRSAWERASGRPASWKQLGHHIIIWRDGKVVRVPPEEIDVEKPSDP